MIIEIKNFSNKALKDVMIENLYKRIVLQIINNTPASDCTNDAIRKIRNEIKEFFSELNKQSSVMKNLGYVICAYFDKNSLISFDDIMETVTI
jgi:predicted ribosome quality control (RQC) complex YloA/Tae2 family protein